MKVLALGQNNSPVTPLIEKRGDEVVEEQRPIDVEYLKKNSIKFIVIYGYRHIIKKSVIDFLPDRIINLHISYLPWNRGADPNLWSFLDNTPKGVSIHYVDTGIDTGDIIAQKEILFKEEQETLASTYCRLQQEIVILFKNIWPDILTCSCPRQSQDKGGSFHTTRDKFFFEHLFLKGWETPVIEISGKAGKSGQLGRI